MNVPALSVEEVLVVLESMEGLAHGYFNGGMWTHGRSKRLPDEVLLKTFGDLMASLPKKLPSEIDRNYIRKNFPDMLRLSRVLSGW